MEYEYGSIDEAFACLHDFGSILDQLGITFMLDGGTLLGFYRDGTFCEDDHDDIDLTTMESDKQIPDILELAAKLGFELYRTWIGDKKTTSQISVKRNGIKVDLMFKKRKGSNAWWTVYKGDEPFYKAVYIENYLGNHPLETPCCTVLIPGENPVVTEHYLEQRYGNWKEKIHRKNYSCYRSDRCLKESYEAI